MKLFDEKQEKQLMICEDDVSFIRSLDKTEVLLENSINDDNLDVHCLGFNNLNQYPYNDYFNLTSDAQTLSCYIVKS